MYFRCILHRILLYSEPVVFRGVFLVISAVFCSVFSCILTPLYSECIFVCISMSLECILLYSRERHFLVPATHPPTRFSREYVFRSRILMYSQSLLRIRISRVFRVYSGVFSRYSRIRTEYRRAYLPKFYTFEIRQNTAYFRNFQNTAEYRTKYSRIQRIGNCSELDRKLYPSPPPPPHATCPSCPTILPPSHTGRLLFPCPTLRSLRSPPSREVEVLRYFLLIKIYYLPPPPPIFCLLRWIWRIWSERSRDLL